MIARWAMFAIMVGTVACRQSKDTDTGAQAPRDLPCDGSAPRVHELVIQDGGMVEYEDSWAPSMLFVFDGRDEDGDLYRYTVDLWYDQDVDGAVAAKADNHIAFEPVDLGGAPCEVDRMSASVRITILGEDTLALDTNYEWAVTLTDAHGIASLPAVVVGKTPTEGEADGR